MDFLLDNKSPLHDPSKTSSSSIGSLKLPVAYFDPLLQTISYMLSQIPIESLNELDRLLLYSPELYEKTLKDAFDSKCVCGFIEKLAWENEKFSMSLAIIILKGLHKVMFDEVRPYCEAFTVFLNLKDSIQSKRIQWLLGFPQMEMICNANGFENFGLYGLNNLDDFHLNFISSINVDGSMTILEVMTHNINRVESVCCVVLKHVLLLAFLNEKIFDYISVLPAPCYLYAKFSDWFKPFLDKYGVELNKSYYGDARKKEIHAEALKYYDLFITKYNEKYPIILNKEKTLEEFQDQKPQIEVEIEEKSPEKIEEKSPEKIEEEEASNNSKEKAEIEELKEDTRNKELPKEDPISNKITDEYSSILQSFLNKPQYILGQTMNETLIEIKKTEDYIFSMKEYSVLALLSKPTGKTNLALPKAIARDHYLFPSSVDSNSPFAGFVHSKYTYSENYGKKTTKLAHFYQFFKTKLALNFTGPGISTPNNSYFKEENPEIKHKNSEQDFKEFSEMSDKIQLFQFECLRKFSLDNRSNKHLLVSFSISPLTGDFQNIQDFKDPILMMTRPYSNIDVFFLQKLNYDLPWDEYSVNLRVFNVFSSETVIKETKLLMCYYDQKDNQGDSILIEENRPGNDNSNNNIIRKRLSNEKNTKDNKKNKTVGFADQEFEVFPEDAEFAELIEKDLSGGGYPGL